MLVLRDLKRDTSVDKNSTSRSSEIYILRQSAPYFLLCFMFSFRNPADARLVTIDNLTNVAERRRNFQAICKLGEQIIFQLEGS